MKLLANSQTKTRLILDSFTTLLRIWGQTAYLLRGRSRANEEFWSQVLAESINSWLAAYILLFLQAKCSKGQKDLSPRPDIRSSTWLKMVKPSGQSALGHCHGQANWKECPFVLPPFLFFIESQNNTGWKGSRKIIRSNISREPRWDYLAPRPRAAWKPPVLGLLTHPFFFFFLVCLSFAYNVFWSGCPYDCIAASLSVCYNINVLGLENVHASGT